MTQPNHTDRIRAAELMAGEICDYAHMRRQMNCLPDADHVVRIISRHLEGEQEHVAWLREVHHGQYEDSGADIITIELCDSDAKGAFKVYAVPHGDFRAGVAACVTKVKAMGDEWRFQGSELPDDFNTMAGAAADITTALESITDSAAAPAQEKVRELQSDPAAHRRSAVYPP